MFSHTGESYQCLVIWENHINVLNIMPTTIFFVCESITNC